MSETCMWIIVTVVLTIFSFGEGMTVSDTLTRSEFLNSPRKFVYQLKDFDKRMADPKSLEFIDKVWQ